MVGYTHAYLRRIVYRDPTSAERFVFITTDHHLRPGLIALLYFLWWKIEKAYDVTKNRLRRQKAWANGEIASSIPAHFAALTHNLLTLLLSTLEDAGLRESKLDQSRSLRAENRPASQRVPAQELVRHAAQLTCQFIRLVRRCLYLKPPGTPPFLSLNPAWNLICSDFPDTIARCRVMIMEFPVKARLSFDRSTLGHSSKTHRSGKIVRESRRAVQRPCLFGETERR